MIETFYILGNGPSLCAEDIACCDMATTIAINSAAELAPDAAILFARDLSWCHANMALVADWQGQAITTNRRAAQELRMEYIAMDRRDDFPPPGSSAIRYGLSSGHAAVSLAIHLGAKRIVLLGFDGRAVNGRTHWHDRYREERQEIYALFNRGWRGWRVAALKMGVQIVNATPGSLIDEFPRIDSLAEAA